MILEISNVPIILSYFFPIIRIEISKFHFRTPMILRGQLEKKVNFYGIFERGLVIIDITRAYDLSF